MFYSMSPLSLRGLFVSLLASKQAVTLTLLWLSKGRSECHNSDTHVWFMPSELLQEEVQEKSQSHLIKMCYSGGLV